MKIILMKNILFLLLVILVSLPASAQNLNKYKYVIIPEKFGFAKEDNQYQINSLTKFLFEKEGFETLMKNEVRPTDLEKDNCLGLTAGLENNSGVFVTRFVITLEDCRGNVVFTSEEGTSREKDFKTAWHEALRDAFSSVQAMNYSFDADALPADPAPSENAVPEIKGEVAKETPASDRESPKFTEIEEAPVPSEEAGEHLVEPDLWFTRNESEFYLEETKNGYRLFQKEMEEPFAVLVKSGGGDDFLYNSVSKQGKAYFSQNGDLIVEHFNPATQEVVKTTYSVKKDQ